MSSSSSDAEIVTGDAPLDIDTGLADADWHDAIWGYFTSTVADKRAAFLEAGSEVASGAQLQQLPQWMTHMRKEVNSSHSLLDISGGADGVH